MVSLARIKEDVIDLNQDWKKAMEDAGCPYMSYIKKVRKEIIRKPDNMYEAIVVYLERRYSVGLTESLIIAKVEVDVALLKIQKHPEIGLCEELESTIRAMQQEAKDHEK